MKNRRTFLFAAGAAGVAAMLAQSEERAAVAAPVAKEPSEAARAVAATMRRFDPKLSASELATIARGIDDSAVASKALRIKRRPLRNGEEPVTSFVVRVD